MGVGVLRLRCYCALRNSNSAQDDTLVKVTSFRDRALASRGRVCARLLFLEVALGFL